MDRKYVLSTTMEHPNNSGPPAGASAVEVDPNLDATAKQINTLTDNTMTKDAERDCHLPHSICVKTIASVHNLHIKSIRSSVPVVLPNIKNRHHPILSFIEFLVYFWTHNFML